MGIKDLQEVVAMKEVQNHISGLLNHKSNPEYIEAINMKILLGCDNNIPIRSCICGTIKVSPINFKLHLHWNIGQNWSWSVILLAADRPTGSECGRKYLLIWIQLTVISY